MTTVATPSPLALRCPALRRLGRVVDSSFERFCLLPEFGAIEQMLCDDAQQLGAHPVRASLRRILQARSAWSRRSCRRSWPRAVLRPNTSGWSLAREPR